MIETGTYIRIHYNGHNHYEKMNKKKQTNEQKKRKKTNTQKNKLTNTPQNKQQEKNRE